MHATITTGVLYAANLIFLTTGLLITVLLLVLTLRAAKLPGTPVANIIFATCALLWSAGGLVNVACLASGMPREGRLALLAQAVQYTGAAAFPIPILTIWRPFAGRPWQKRWARLVGISACVSAAAISILLWSAPVLGAAGQFLAATAKHVTAYNATFLLTLGAFVSLRRKVTPGAIYLPSLAVVFAVCGGLITMTFARNSPANVGPGPLFGFIGGHLLLLAVLCAFLLFARFRFADLFIRYGVRILLAGAWATFLAYSVQSAWLLHLTVRSASPRTVHTFIILLLANGLLLSFTFVDETISGFLNKCLFHAPDYRAATRQLANQVRDLQAESEIAAAVEEAARGPLELNGARLAALDHLPSAHWPAGILAGEMVELDYADPLRASFPIPNVEVIFPIASAGRVTHLLLVAPGGARPNLMMQDLNYLLTVAALCGNRLDALRREREAAERQSREALLVQQVTEAELRALRAQINPHFLFNSLNTIADLVVRDPARAEAMTMRLAGVFRHVLANSSRPLTSVRDEVEFLRTYLYIEEVRFGDRLQVAIDVAPEIAGEQIPSLILQPLVENALKHGLGPKPGPGHLWISAQAQGNDIRLRIDDDGIGPNGRSAMGSGLGLANVSERLRTLYHDRFSVILEPREGGGSRVTVIIPRGAAVSKV